MYEAARGINQSCRIVDIAVPSNFIVSPLLKLKLRFSDNENNKFVSILFV